MKLGKLLGLSLLLSAGCLSVPPNDNPLMLRAATGEIENPVVIVPGKPAGPDFTRAPAYAQVFESVVSVIGDYFEIAYSNRYDGKIISQPKIRVMARPEIDGMQMAKKPARISKTLRKIDQLMALGARLARVAGVELMDRSSRSRRYRAQGMGGEYHKSQLC